MKKHQWAVVSAVLNLLGGAFLLFSFQATSTDLLMVSGKGGETAFCVGKDAFFVMRPGHGIGVGTTCPESKGDARPTAVVNTDRPAFVTIGLVLVLCGFFAQLLSIDIPRAKLTKAQKRQLKLKLSN